MCYCAIFFCWRLYTSPMSWNPQSKQVHSIFISLYKTYTVCYLLHQSLFHSQWSLLHFNLIHIYVIRLIALLSVIICFISAYNRYVACFTLFHWWSLITWLVLEQGNNIYCLMWSILDRFSVFLTISSRMLEKRMNFPFASIFALQPNTSLEKL